MSKSQISGLTLDAGALIALERDDSKVRALLDRALQNGVELAIPAGVIGQVWRGGTGTQFPLTRLLSDPRIKTVPLDVPAARAAGVLCGAAGHPDVIDASAIICARERNHSIVTSDRGDMTKLDPKAALIEV